MTNTCDIDQDPPHGKGPGEDYHQYPHPHYPQYFNPKTFHGTPEELDSFLEDFDMLCEQYRITSPEEKYVRILQLCSSKIAKSQKRMPSHKHKDYDLLIKELRYFYGDSKSKFSIAKIEKFSAKWRARDISTIQAFKRYHRKYLELVGPARESRKISSWDYDRYFWEGLNRSLRRKIENRMLTVNPDLDITQPFDISQVAGAAEYLLSPYRFDQHLLKQSGYGSSDTESEPDRPPKSKRKKRHSSYEESDSDSETSIEMLPRRNRDYQRREPPPHFRDRRPPRSDGEVGRLTSQMGNLHLSDSNRRAPFPPLPQQGRNPPFNQPPRGPFQGNNPGGRNPYQRDEPPHIARNSGPGPTFNRPEPFCFGCGKGGHRMGECEELNSLMRKGQASRNPITGKIQRPDGAPIFKGPNESWVQAITQNNRQASLAQVREEDESINEEANYGYQATIREDADYSIGEEIGMFNSEEEAEDLGWTTPSRITERQTFSAQRTEGVSKERRRKGQQYPLNGPQRVKQLPNHREVHGALKPGMPIPKDHQPNSNQTGAPKGPIPFDVNKNKFEGKTDNQFLPMNVDQEPLGKRGDNPGKKATHQGRAHIPKITNPGAINEGRESVKIAGDIMNLPLTLTVREACGISPRLRKDLAQATRPVHEVSPQNEERNGFAGQAVNALDEMDDLPPSEDFEDFHDLDQDEIPLPRRDLLRIPARIGKARVRALFDTGSEVNLISHNLLKQSGIPWIREPACKVSVLGISGEATRCIGRVPRVQISTTQHGLPTYGRFNVLPNSNVAIFGRHWGTENRAGLEERNDGSHLNFVSGKNRYGMNVAPIEKDETTGQYNLPKVYHMGKLQPTMAKAHAASIISDSEKSDEELQPGEIREENTKEAPDEEERVPARKGNYSHPLVPIEQWTEEEESPPTPAQRPIDEGELDYTSGEDRTYDRNRGSSVSQALEEAAEAREKGERE